jgi:hypothetical protein
MQHVCLNSNEWHCATVLGSVTRFNLHIIGVLFAIRCKSAAPAVATAIRAACVDQNCWRPQPVSALVMVVVVVVVFV